MVEITSRQFEYLQGFYAHCFAVYHENVVSDFSFWSKQLDTECVPWAVQNMVSAFAESKDTIRYYLRSLLNKKGVTVV